MQVTPVSLYSNSSVSKPKENIATNFRKTEKFSDSFEQQDSEKKLSKSTIKDIVAGSLILGLSAALIYKHNGLSKVKSQVETLEKAKKELELSKKELEEAKKLIEESLNKANKDSSRKTKELEDKIKALENKIKQLEKKEGTLPKPEEKVKNKNAEESKSESTENLDIKNKGELDNKENTQLNVDGNQTLSPNTNKIANAIVVQEVLSQLENRKGLSRILGYNDLKSKILDKVIFPIKNNQDDIPNLVLLYGPKGCGKTLMGKAIAEQADCHCQKLVSLLNSQKDYETLQNAIKTARENYQKTGKHTILRCDEFNGFLREADAKTKALINNLAKENHCTIVATTNYPKQVNPNLIPDDGIHQFFVKIPKESDIEEILKFYFSLFSEESVNYSELVKVIDKNNGYYSNSRFVQKIKEFVKTKSEFDKKFSQSDIEEFLKALKPDIIN